MQRIIFSYPATGVITDTLVLIQGLELNPPRITVEYPSPTLNTFGGQMYTYRKSVARKLIPLKIDIMNDADKAAVKDWYENVVQGSTNTFSYINQEGNNREFEVRILDEVLDFDEGTFPYSVEMTLLVVNEIRRWDVSTSIGFLWNISLLPEPGSGEWEIYGDTPQWVTGIHGYGDNWWPAMPFVRVNGAGEIQEIIQAYSFSNPGGGLEYYYRWKEGGNAWNAEPVSGNYSARFYWGMTLFNSRVYYGGQTNSFMERISSTSGKSIINGYGGSGTDSVTCFAEYLTEIYVGMEGGDIYKSATGDSNTWSLSLTTGEEDVYALFVWNGDLYAGTANAATADGKIMRLKSSVWSTVFTYAAGDEGYVRDFASWDSGDGNGEQIYAAMGSETGGNGGKIYRSTSGDSGSWNNVASLDYQVFSLAVHDNYMYAGTYNTGKIYRSSNGTTWTDNVFTMDDGGSSQIVHTLLSADGSIFAGLGSDSTSNSKGGSVYASVSGSAWVEEYNAPASRIYKLISAFGDVYASGGFNKKGSGLLFRRRPDSNWDEIFRIGGDLNTGSYSYAGFAGVYWQYFFRYRIHAPVFFKNYYYFSGARYFYYTNDWTSVSRYTITNQRNIRHIICDNSYLTWMWMNSNTTVQSHFYYIQNPGDVETRFDPVTSLGHGAYALGRSMGGGSIHGITGNYDPYLGSAFIWEDREVGSPYDYYIFITTTSPIAGWAAYALTDWYSNSQNQWPFPISDGDNTDLFYMVLSKASDGNNHWLYEINRFTGVITSLFAVSGSSERINGMFWHSGKLWMSVFSDGKEIGYYDKTAGDMVWLTSDTPTVDWDSWDSFFHDGTYFRLLGAFEIGDWGYSPAGTNGKDIRRI